MRILVTGGAGFIGSHLVEALIRKKHCVVVVDNLSTGKKDHLHPRAIFYKTDIKDKRLYSIFKKEKIDYVFHLAAQKNLQYSRLHPVEDAVTNIIGSLRVMQAASQNRVRKIIFFSSAAVYDPRAKPPNAETEVLRPISPYGIAKMTIEEYLVHSSFNYTIIRPSNVYGPRQDALGEGGVVAIFCDQAARSLSAKINNTGRQTRDFIYVTDVVAAATQALDRGSRAILNVSTGIETPINVLYGIVYHLAGCRRAPRRGYHVEEQFRSSLDNRRAGKVLSWRPGVFLADGLAETYHWFKRQHEKNI